MGIKNEFSGIENLEILRELEDGLGTRKEMAHKYNVNISTLGKGKRKYDHYCLQGLEIRTCNNSYSAELKLQAVQNLYGRLTVAPGAASVLVQFCPRHQATINPENPAAF